MIFGIVHRDKNVSVKKEALFALLRANTAKEAVSTFAKKQVALGVSPIGVPTIDDGVGLTCSSNKKIVVAASGNIYNFKEAQQLTDSKDAFSKDEVAKLILAAYQSRGEACFEKFNGNWSAAICDATRNKFVLALDHVGLEPLFYFWDGQKLIFSSSFKSLIRHPEIERTFYYRALRNYLLFNYNAGMDTFIKNVKKVRPGHYLVLENDRLEKRRYWHLAYTDKNGAKVEQDYAEELLTLTRDAINVRANENDGEPGAFLSGGMDSSSVVGLLSEVTHQRIHTFSFRCPEKFVDESHFARVMAEHYKTQHNEIPFTAEKLTNLDRMTEWMEEPLSDIGVELGSFIMGSAAHDKVRYILTGDGGDELYAGHPVYMADRMAAKFDRIPAPLRAGIAKTAGLLPDTDKKKSLLVKSRRFAYSYGFPAELLSNRWRIYYNAHELRQLCTMDVLKQFGDLDSYHDITDLYDGVDAPDYLSRCLYGDYQTLVRFHVDRLRLTRAFGIEARFPLHDYRLIEFSSRIPADLKIRGSQVKYIQKKALESVLPDEIVHRKDKMGHNVPMKNWMRHSPIFRDLLNDALSESAMKKRNLFNYHYVQQMLSSHLNKTKDYSHRLYGLLILELWMQKNLDN
ncbi:MAG: asparagine synthetase B family protein [bacterium]